jgi:hypothetical protein
MILTTKRIGQQNLFEKKAKKTPSQAPKGIQED